MNDLFDNEPKSQSEPVTWPRVVMAPISAFVILGLCAGCVIAAWLMKP